MNIKRLVIENFKSIERIELIEPNPFTVFVGPNGSGKSNIFEALEFNNRIAQSNVFDAVRLHGGPSKIVRRNNLPEIKLKFNYLFEDEQEASTVLEVKKGELTSTTESGMQVHPSFVREMELKSKLAPTKYSEQSQTRGTFYDNFKRLFVKNTILLKTDYQDDLALNFAATNLEKVLGRILSYEILRQEIFEWLNLFIPGFKAVEVDDRDELHWFEEGSDRYFTKDLISDGTYNILALLTAVYQADEPQFLCIEEPENGLHPEVLESLINFFRNQCAEKGHYIWLNTHSESIVKLLTTDEIILVNKRDGATQTKQVKGMNTYSLTTDEAWLSGALGGGLAW